MSVRNRIWSKLSSQMWKFEATRRKLGSLNFDHCCRRIWNFFWGFTIKLLRLRWLWFKDSDSQQIETFPLLYTSVDDMRVKEQIQFLTSSKWKLSSLLLEEGSVGVREWVVFWRTQKSFPFELFPLNSVVSPAQFNMKNNEECLSWKQFLKLCQRRMKENNQTSHRLKSTRVHTFLFLIRTLSSLSLLQPLLLSQWWVELK